MNSQKYRLLDRLTVCMIKHNRNVLRNLFFLVSLLVCIALNIHTMMTIDCESKDLHAVAELARNEEEEHRELMCQSYMLNHDFHVEKI